MKLFATGVVTSRDALTALHHAALAGCVNTVELLLSNNFVVDVKDTKGSTPLTLAIRIKRKDTVSLLLRAGASVHA